MQRRRHHHRVQGDAPAAPGSQRRARTDGRHARTPVEGLSELPPVDLLCVGDLNADFAISLDHDLAIGSDTDGRIRMHGGGSAANVAVWAARSGASVRFVGAVGDDDLGRLLTTGVRDAGVDAHVVTRPNAATRAVAAIVGPDGNRSLISDLDHTMTLTESDLDAQQLDGVSWLHLTGYTYLTEHSRALFLQLTAAASERGVPWSIDPSAAQLIRARSDLDAVRTAFAGSNIMFPSADEAMLLAGVDDPVQAAVALLDLSQCVAVTQGPDGATVVRRGATPFSVPAAPTTLRNALGCGDAFAAGFLTAHLAGADDHAAAVAATHVAAAAAALDAAR